MSGPVQAGKPRRGPVYDPPLFIDRPRAVQVISAGVIPALLGAVAGVLLGVSSGAYYAVGALAGIGGFLAGFEHRDGWGGADRGFSGGAIYGTALLLVHALVGTHAKVSLGSFPPFLAVITAIIGMFLSAAGGRIARLQRERASQALKAARTASPPP
jgi:hypothetical protein